MRKQFATQKGYIVYCDDDILRITTPKKFFIKSKIYEISVKEIKKCDIDDRLNMVFYTKNDNIWNSVDIANSNFEIANKIKDFFTTNNAKNLVKRKNNMRIVENKENTYSTYVAGTSYHEEEVEKVFNFMKKNTDVTYRGLTKKELKEQKIIVYELDNTKCFVSAELEEEYTNEFDENAIKINAILDDEKCFVGYIPAKVAKKLKQNIGKVETVLLYPDGGKYKGYKVCGYESDNKGNPKEQLEYVEDEYDMNFIVEIKFSEPI